MKIVFIVGGAGKVGRRLVRQLVERGHQPIGLHRRPEQAEALGLLGAIPVFGSLLDLDMYSMSQLMSGSDIVVFSAGAGGKGGMEMTNAIDGRGLELTVAAAKLSGIQRFLLVSAFPEAARGKKMSDTFENYLAVKKLADACLSETDLDWVILRPGTLQDLPGTGKVRAGPAIPYGSVSRDDVAATLVELIERPEVSRVIIELTEGKTPVDEAIRKLAHKDLGQATGAPDR